MFLLTALELRKKTTTMGTYSKCLYISTTSHLASMNGMSERSNKSNYA